MQYCVYPFAVTFLLSEVLLYPNEPRVRAIWQEMSAQLGGCLACMFSYHDCQLRIRCAHSARGVWGRNARTATGRYRRVLCALLAE